MKLNPLDWGYDLESYPNIFTASFKHVVTGQCREFEISEWRCDHKELIQFLYAMRQMQCRNIGYNNIGYDYPLLHFVIHSYKPAFSHYSEIYQESYRIIDTPWSNRYDNVIWYEDVAIEQIDLFKIHHFDNKHRRTSLKAIAFAMRSKNIQDLPFPPGTTLTYSQSRDLITYNAHDVDETLDFHRHSIEAINFREQLGKRYINFSEVKIGKEYIIDELEKAKPGMCYNYDSGKRRPNQTICSSINIGDVIFDYIKFERQEFQIIYEWLKQKTVTETKGAFKDSEAIKAVYQQLGLSPKKLPESMSTVINGFTFSFGLGGIHGSIDSTIVASDDGFVIVDIDGESYYPNVAIQNILHPKHFTELFCKIYNQTYQQRRKHKKGTMENAILKLALVGGGFGGSGDKFCPIFDINYMLSITVNGQLLLCLLAEQLLKIPNLQLIQANTDGVTVRCPRNYMQVLNDVCAWWEKFTCIKLENVNYKRMFIRDVNNYIGEYEDGKLKRKGAYGHETPLDNPYTREREWHNNHSMLLVPKAAEAALVRGESIENFIINHDDIFDFMLLAKAKHPSKLMLGDEQVQGISRYYVSNSSTANTLIKISPPAKGKIVGQYRRKNKLSDNYYDTVIAELRSNGNKTALDTTGTPWDKRINSKNGSKYKDSNTNLQKGYKVKIANDIAIASRHDIDYSYYINEAKKLVEVLQ